MYFILKGKFGIQFQFGVADPGNSDDEQEHNDGPKIAKDYLPPIYIGEYYLLSQKKSEFTYVVCKNQVIEAFALTKSFMFEVIFEKYPSLLQEMIGTAHNRYN